MGPSASFGPDDLHARSQRRRRSRAGGGRLLTRRELLLGGGALLTLAAIETLEHTRIGDDLGHVRLPSPSGGGPRSVIDFLAGYLSEIVRDGARPFALASVDGGQSYWHRRAGGEDRMAMLMSEFLPLCEGRYGLGGSRARRAGMGWSMGGYGVLLAAETRPHLFSSVVATSPAIWPTYQDMMNGPRDAFDSAADFAAHDVIGHAARLAGTPLLVDCGTADPFYPFVRDLCAVLPAGAHHHYLPGAGHDFASWSRFQPAALRFVARHFGD